MKSWWQVTKSSACAAPGESDLLLIKIQWASSSELWAHHMEHLVHWWIMQIRHHLFLHYIIRHGMNLNEQNSTRTRPELKQNSSTTWAEPEQNSSTTRAQLKQNSVTTRAKTNMFQIFCLDPCLTSFFTTYEYSLTHELWKKTSTELN